MLDKDVSEFRYVGPATLEAQKRQRTLEAQKPTQTQKRANILRAGFEANQHKKKTHSRFRLPNSSVFKGPAGFAARAHMRLREFLLEASESIPLPNSRSSPSVRSVINSMVCTHTQQCTHCFTLLCTHRIPGSHENTRRHQSHQGYLVASMMSSDRRHQRRRRPRWKICGCKPTLVDVRQKRSRADSYP